MNKLPITRLLLVVALLVSSGLFALRGYSLLTQSVAPPSTSLAEQEVTHLIETLVGTGQVRVSIKASQPKSYLVLIDGERTPLDPNLQANIDTILRIAQNFDPETETLVVEQYPFAQRFGARLSQQDAIELLLLFGLLCLQTSLVLTHRRDTTPQLRYAPTELQSPPPMVQTPADLTLQSAASNPDLSKAVQLTKTHPDQAVSLLRNWMKSQEGNA